MVNVEEKIKELEERILRLEVRVFNEKGATGKVAPFKGPQPKLEDLKIPAKLLTTLQTRIRKVSYWNLVLLLLYFASGGLTYSNIMEMSKQLRKPVSYDWLNTEFHRKKYSGLVRSESVSGSQEKAYSLNEPGRRKAEVFLQTLELDDR
jgi:hypothetical protein